MHREGLSPGWCSETGPYALPVTLSHLCPGIPWVRLHHKDLELPWVSRSSIREVVDFSLPHLKSPRPKEQSFAHFTPFHEIAHRQARLSAEKGKISPCLVSVICRQAEPTGWMACGWSEGVGRCPLPCMHCPDHRDQGTTRCSCPYERTNLLLPGTTLVWL